MSEEYKQGLLDGLLESRRIAIDETSKNYEKDRETILDSQMLARDYRNRAQGAKSIVEQINAKLENIKGGTNSQLLRLVEAERLLGPILFEEGKGKYSITLDFFDREVYGPDLRDGLFKRVEEIRAYFKKYGEKT